MDALAKAKLTTFAESVKPEIVKPADPKAAAAGDIASCFCTFRTHIKLFIISTGNDTGSKCELQGNIHFHNPFHAQDPFISKAIDVELPIKRSWADDNKGLGRLLAELSYDTVLLPASFGAFLVEDDPVGDDIIVSYVLEWTPANLHMADGNEWTLKSWNTGDKRFAAHLWWKVTRLS